MMHETTGGVARSDHPANRTKVVRRTANLELTGISFRETLSFYK